MARPRKVGLDYFPHDAAASHDTKLMAMELEHGLAGYAFFFKILEILYAEGSLDMRNKATYGACVKALGVGREAFDAMLDTALECGLFEQETYDKSGILTSYSIQKRIESVNSRRVSVAETSQKPNSNTASCSVSAEFPSRVKEKESKEKESKEDIPSSSKPKKGKSIFSDESDEMKLCRLLASRMRKNNPNCRLPDDMQPWCKIVDLMIRRDNRTPQQIQSVIVFSQSDQFWMSNILSMKTLREKFDALSLKQQKGAQANAESVGNLDLPTTGNTAGGNTSFGTLL